jgi:hypothetical protein
MSETEYLNKYVTVEKDIWNKLKDYSALPENRRQAGQQAGIIIKTYLGDHDTMADTWKYLISELDYIIDNTQKLGKLDELYAKKETLKKALYRVGGSL